LPRPCESQNDLGPSIVVLIFSSPAVPSTDNGTEGGKSPPSIPSTSQFCWYPWISPTTSCLSASVSCQNVCCFRLANHAGGLKVSLCCSCCSTHSDTVVPRAAACTATLQCHVLLHAQRHCSATCCCTHNDTAVSQFPFEHFVVLSACRLHFRINVFSVNKMTYLCCT
jgi:hypothetical protein